MEEEPGLGEEVRAKPLSLCAVREGRETIIYSYIKG